MRAIYTNVQCSTLWITAVGALTGFTEHVTVSNSFWDRCYFHYLRVKCRNGLRIDASHFIRRLTAVVLLIWQDTWLHSYVHTCIS